MTKWVSVTLLLLCLKVSPPAWSKVPASVFTVIWPPLTGKCSVLFAVAGATMSAVMPACMRAADTAGLTTTAVLLPITVALAETYVVVAGGLELARPVAAVLLLEPPPQAARPSPAATITAVAKCREQLRRKPISSLLRLAKADDDHVEVARALSPNLGRGSGALIRLLGHRVDLHELGCCRLARGECVEVA